MSILNYAATVFIQSAKKTTYNNTLVYTVHQTQYLVTEQARLNIGNIPAA